MLVIRLAQNLDPRSPVDVLQDLQVRFQALFVLFELGNGLFLLVDLVFERPPRRDHQFIGQIDTDGCDGGQQNRPEN